MDSARVLITGANGFVGRRLLAALPDADTLSMRSANTAWSGALPQKKWVVHLAARVHQVQDLAVDPLAEYRRVNTAATLELARQSAQAGVQRFVFLSSVKVNGESTEAGRPFTETDSAHPSDPYGISKWEAEQGLAAIARETGMEVVIIRPPLVYGPGVKANFAALMRAVQRGIPLPLGAIHNLRSLLGLDNLVDFIMTCAIHPQAANQIFLVSDGHDVSASELVRSMARVAGLPNRQIPVPVRLLKLAGNLLGKSAAVDRLCGNLQLDISKSRSILGWNPPIDFDEGIRRAMQTQQVPGHHAP